MAKSDYVNRITRWYTSARRNGASHFIVYYDKTGKSHYMQYVTPAEDITNTIERLKANGHDVLEVYSTKILVDAQVAEAKAWHVD
jgi:hypothetical protein